MAKKKTITDLVKMKENGEIVSWATIDTLCTLLNCQPGDLVEHHKEQNEGE